MNEHPVDRDLETARTVQIWLERTADELPDNPTGRERLLDQVDRTSQRSAPWLPPVFPGGIGTMFSAARLAAAAGIVIIFTGLLLMSFLPRDEAAVVTPGAETAPPSAQATEDPVANAYVTGRIAGTIEWGVPDDQAFKEPVSHWEGDVYTLRDEYHVRQIEWSDGRLPPEMHVWVNRDEYVLDPAFPSRRGGVSHGRVRLEDDQGSWAGQLEGVFPRDDRYVTEWFALTGSAAYEGLYAVLIASHWYDTEAFEFRNEIVGLIGEGEPPPARPAPTTEEQP